MLKTTRDSAQIDNADGSESVIAACIQRFRYQAPSSSESRSHISREKFWWLKSSHEDNDVDDLPEMHLGSVFSDRFDATKLRNDSRDSDDFLSLESDSPYPRELPKMKEMLNHDSSHTHLSSLPESSMTTNAQLDVVFNLDNYAERLLMKCDMLLKGYGTSSTGERSLSNKGKSATTIIETKSHRHYSVLNKSNLKALDNEEINDAKDSISENSSCDHHQLDSKILLYPMGGKQDERASKTDLSLNQSYSGDDMTVSPIGLSLALSAESWGELLTSRKEFIQQENNLRSVTTSAGDTKAESNVLIGGMVAADYSLETASEYVPYLPSFCPSDHDTTVVPALLKSPDTFLYVSSSSEIGATVRVANKISNQEKGYHLANNQNEDYAHGHQPLENYDHESDQETDRGNDKKDSCIDNVAVGPWKDIDVDHASTEDSSNDHCADSQVIDKDNDESRDNQGEVSFALSSSTGARSVHDDLMALEQELSPNPADCPRLLKGMEQELSPNPADCPKPLLPSPLTEAEVSPYLKDAIIHLLWTRLCIVRSQISQEESHALSSS